MSEDSKTGTSVESDDPRESPDDREEMDDYLRLILDSDDQTPEEAGYGHGV